MIVHSVSEAFKEHLPETGNVLYANLELRPKGVILSFSIQYMSVAWVIPFYKLSIFKSLEFSLQADGHFVKFKTDNNYMMNKPFIEKLLQRKATFTSANSTIL